MGVGLKLPVVLPALVDIRTLYPSGNAGSKAISRQAIFKLLPVRVIGGVISQSLEVPRGLIL